MIVIVAPYSPPGSSGHSNLGAHRKIEMIISVLSQFGLPLLLVNSAHNEKKFAPLKIKKLTVSNITLTEIIPPLWPNITLGKLMNLFAMRGVLKAIEQFGHPDLIWFYNGYAFEMLLASKLWHKFFVPMILEFEDWHFARSRSYNPKPFIDYFFWWKASKLMSGVFAVNSVLANKAKMAGSHVYLLPGIVPNILEKISQDSEPFVNYHGTINIGYFGGLSVEKGADIALDLSKQLPPGYHLHLCGAGSLQASCEAYARQNLQNFTFHGLVSDTSLYELISKCDIILNPHVPISKMDGGLFPFKVIEAVASGRLLISTSLPTEGLEDVLAGVLFVKNTTAAFHAAVIMSHQYYLDNRNLILSGARSAKSRFGEAALVKTIKAIMGT